MKNHKNTIIGVIVILLMIGGLILIARPNPSDSNSADTPSGSGGALTTEEPNWNFGTISMAAGKISHIFKIKNVGRGNLTISTIYTSCMCTTALLIKGGEKFGPYGMPGHGFTPKINQTIKPNEEADIEVVFDPAAHGPAGVGEIQRMVRIESDSGKPVDLEFKAVVTP